MRISELITTLTNTEELGSSRLNNYNNSNGGNTKAFELLLEAKQLLTNCAPTRFSFSVGIFSFTNLM